MYSISIFARNEYGQQIFNYYNNKHFSQSTEFARQRKLDFWNTHTDFRHGVYRTIILARQSLVGRGLLINPGFTSTLRLLWMSDQPKAETSTWQNTTFTRDRHPWPDGIRTSTPRNWVAADPHFRPRGHWDSLFGTNGSYNSEESGTECIKL
jgi:hypothetical protein